VGAVEAVVETAGVGAAAGGVSIGDFRYQIRLTAQNVAMRSLLAASSALTIALMSSCGLFDSGTNWRSGQFEVLWIDVDSQSSLVYRLDGSSSIGIVGPCVFAAGANVEFVAVEQMPPDRREGIKYFVISKASYDPVHERGDAVVGPLSGEDFRAIGARVHLPPLKEFMSERVCASRP
jgi:hypothetical protein